MLSDADATILAKRNLPGRELSKPVPYRGLFLFIATDPNDPDEGDFDPFYSVNQSTGEFKEFSVITDGDITEIADLFP